LGAKRGKEKKKRGRGKKNRRDFRQLTTLDEMGKKRAGKGGGGGESIRKPSPAITGDQGGIGKALEEGKGAARKKKKHKKKVLGGAG